MKLKNNQNIINDFAVFKHGLKERKVVNAKIISRDDTKSLYEVELVKEPNKMSKTDLILQELKGMNTKLTSIDDRLTKAEARLTNIEACPTIQKELKK